MPDARERARELAAVLVAVLAARAAMARRITSVERLGHVEADALRVRRILEHEATEQRDDVLGLEDVAPGDEAEEHRAERVDVGARVDRLRRAPARAP